MSIPPASPDAPAAPTTMADAGTESLRHGQIHTDISPTLAKVITLLFLLGIFAVPVIQAARELIRERRIQALEVVKPPARAAKQLFAGDPTQAARTLKSWLSKDSLLEYEHALEDASLFRRRIQPRVQLAMTRFGGFGNAMVIKGARGWLYYQLGLNHLAGPGFLDPRFLSLRERTLFNEGENDPNADPRTAIIQFHNDARAAGVHLVIMPVPIKEMIEPHALTGRLDFPDGAPIPHNADYARFISDLRDAGVDVFDSFIPNTVLSRQTPLYLHRDTHWTPQWMEEVAQSLARHIQSQIQLPPVDFSTRIEPAEISHVGDLVDTLKLPVDQTLYPPQRVRIHRVLDAATGEPIASRPDADVIFIGDSFSNIYSAPEMRWGDSAGLPFQLARHLNRPLDMLLKNGGAATEMREALLQRPSPLAGKRVIVWQVAMHELSASNWRVIPMAESARPR